MTKTLFERMTERLKDPVEIQARPKGGRLPLLRQAAP
jgi:hypothetical protein